ncbi:MAG: hypothetical protein GWP91_21690 [Rhodobacterales bacterium]|nr:hypothetical protein [Rhodobacterales bacterium]
MKNFTSLLLAVSLIGCGGGVVEGFEQCAIDAMPVPATGTPGDTIVLKGGPFGESWDNLVQIDGAPAQVQSTEQTERLDSEGVVIEANACDRCDNCREREAGHCNRCEAACLNCVDTLTFTVPDTAPGAHSLQVVNRWGGSDFVAFEVQGLATTTSGDTGLSTTGLNSSSTGDTGVTATGLTSTGVILGTADTAISTTSTGGGTANTADTSTFDTADTQLPDTGNTPP